MAEQTTTTAVKTGLKTPMVRQTTTTVDLVKLETTMADQVQMKQTERLMLATRAMSEQAESSRAYLIIIGCSKLALYGHLRADWLFENDLYGYVRADRQFGNDPFGRVELNRKFRKGLCGRIRADRKFRDDLCSHIRADTKFRAHRKLWEDLHRDTTE